MRHYLLAAAVAVALAPAAAYADCTFDLAQLKTRLSREHDQDLLIAVRKEIAKAQAAQKVSETECRNHVIRGWRIVRAASDAVPTTGSSAVQTGPKGPSAPSAPNAPTDPIGPLDGSVR